MGKKTSAVKARVIAAAVLTRVLKDRQLLDRCLSDALSTVTDTRERSLAYELCYGVLRWLPRLNGIVTELLDRPVRRRDLDLNVLLLLGLYQLAYTRIPPHAAVAETVALTRHLGKPWASGLINATLRRYQARSTDLTTRLEGHEEVRFAHPQWLIDELRAAWPDDWKDILEQNNQRAPMTLRVNAGICTRERYLGKLAAAGMTAEPAPYTLSGVTLHQAVPTEQLPGFELGLVSVQDGAAQLASQILAPRAGDRVLDACAAPGGKTAHILESAPDIGELVAIEREPARTTLISETLSRLGLSATLITTDARDTASWWDGKGFDRILLDAPCSASGVIRRHPDIKTLRQKEDVDRLIDVQAGLLEALWGVLAPGGWLVYATCSIFPAENQDQIDRFLQRRSDADLRPIAGPWGKDVQPGRQILPGMEAMDGFYYAVLQKH